MLKIYTTNKKQNYVENWFNPETMTILTMSMFYNKSSPPKFQTPNL